MQSLPSGWLEGICLVILISILTAGLWPFNFLPTNQVTWLPNRDGVFFYGQGLIFGDAPVGQAMSTLEKSITLEIRITPSSDKASAPAILTFYDDEGEEYLYLGQWRSHLVIKSKADNPALQKRGRTHQHIGVRDSLPVNRNVLLTITSGGMGTTLYINGRLIRAFPGYRLNISRSTQPLRLTLGNAPSAQNSWTGCFLGLAIYQRILTGDQVARNYHTWLTRDWEALKRTEGIRCLFTFSERQGEITTDRIDPARRLNIPHILTPTQRIILDPPWHNFRLDWSLISDVGINILGFIPLGLFGALLIKRKTSMSTRGLYIVVTLIGLGLSLFIELSQIYLPSRYSQLSDVVCNTLGTLVGLLLFCLATSVKEEVNRKQ